MHKLREMAMKEIEAIEKKGQISMSDLEKAQKLTDTVKNIYKIEMLEDGGYSEDGHYMGEGRIYGTSYAGRRTAKRDSMGRYSREGHDDGYHRYGGYSYKDKSEMIDHLHEMMEEAGSTKEREAIKRCINELEE